MRRAFLSAIVLASLSLFAGCKHCVTWHGVCDCDHDDMCCTRQPWLNNAPVPAPGPIHTPALGPVSTPTMPVADAPQSTAVRPSGL